MSQKPTYKELEQRILELEKAEFERKIAVDALRESEIKHKTFVHNIPGMVYRANTDWSAEIISGSKEVCGYTNEELNSKEESWLSIIHPDDKEKVLKEGSELTKKQQDAVQTYRIIAKDGNIRWVEDRKTSLFSEGGEFKGIDGIVFDITARKQTEKMLQESEEKYRNLVEQSNDGIIIVQNGIVKFSNTRLAEMFGYAVEEMINTPVLDYVFPHEQSRIHDIYKRRLQGESVPDIYEMIGLHKDGRKVDIETNAGSITYHGKPAILSFIRDITDRKRMEKELLQSKKLESIAFLAGGIAHDFNNLLSVIMGNIELAKVYTKHEFGVSEFLKDAKKAALQANELTKTIITFSKGGEPVKKVSSIGNLIKETTNSLVFGTNVRCEYFIPHDLYLIELDEGQIKHAVKNLIDNAIESMPDGGSINVQAENFEVNSKSEYSSLPISEGKYVKISIRDKGVGIPEEHLSMVFDPYFSTKEMGTQKGMGLGLATTYSIINRHDGHITVESEVGVGSIFTLYFPAYVKDARRLEPIAIPIPEKSKIRTNRILVMDDEEMIRDLAKQILKRLGYETEPAKDGDEAIELYKKAMSAGNRFDIIILDLTVKGGMGGKDAVKKIRKIDPQVKAIVSSGHATDPVMTNFRKYGFIDVLPKPYTMKDMREALNKVSEK